MEKTEKRRRFIINFIFIALWAVLLYGILKFALPMLMPFAMAFLIAFVLKPVINFITGKTPLSRRAAAILVLSLAYILVGGLLILLVFKLRVTVVGWFTGLPEYYVGTVEPALQTIGGMIDSLVAGIDPALAEFIGSMSETILTTLSGFVAGLSSTAVNMASSVGWFVVSTFLTIIASYFLVVDYYKVTGFVTKQLSENARRKLFVVKDFIVNVLLRFGSAYLILMTLTFIEVSVGLLILGAASPFTVAFFTAIVDILPVFGTGTVMIPWAVYSLLTGNYFFAIGLMVLYAVITIVRQILEPRVVGRQIGLYPLLTLICMFLGVRLFGFWGLFGLPIALTVIIHLNRAGEIKLFKE